MHYSVYSQMSDVVKYLITIGGNVLLRNSRGFSVLDVAERVGNKEILKIVTEAAANQKDIDENKEKIDKITIINDYLKDAKTPNKS